MIFLLVFFLIAFLGVAYFVLKKDIMNPVIFIISGYIMSAVIGAINFNQWGNISSITVLTIILAVLFFFLGSIFVQAVFQTKTIKTKNKVDSFVYINFKVQIAIVIFMSIVSYFYAVYIYENSIIGGNPGGLQNVLTYARIAFQRGTNTDLPFLLNLSLKLSQVFAYIISYAIVHNVVYYRERKPGLLQSIILLLFIFQSVTSGGRTKMMYFILFLFIIFATLLKHKNARNPKIDLKIIRYTFLSIAIGLALFIIIDLTLRGSIYGTERGVFSQLSLYISSSIFALDQYLSNPTHMTNFYDSETLFPIYSLLNYFGAEINFTSNALSFVSVGNQMTNIYTALRRYIHDFHFAGMLLIQFLLGVLYQSYYLYVKHKGSIKHLIIYGMISYPVVFSFIEERFINDILSLNMVIIVFTTYLICFKILRFKKTRG